MNETMQTILNRRSVRAFTAQPIPEEILKDLVEAALHAPSGMGKKTWQFTVVENREKIDSFAAAVKGVCKRDPYDMYRPAALIIPSNERDSIFGKEDNACALQNIFLAAQSYGIGSVWINQLQGNCDDPAIRPFLKEWGIPDNHVVYGLAALGYADPAIEVRAYRAVGEVKYVK